MQKNTEIRQNSRLTGAGGESIITIFRFIYSFKAKKGAVFRGEASAALPAAYPAGRAYSGQPASA
jgi:hypothetical protein